MSKHETPPFRMIVQRGKLVPATAYDAERLDTWRNGAEVNVRFVEDRSRWGIRKWWAVINRAVKECSTPWQTAAEASEAVKLALGIVNLTKTVGGEFLAYPKSLTELDDPELEDAVEQMLAVIYRVTGVEPDEWRKQISGIGEHEHENPADALPAGGSDGAASSPDRETVAAPLSADEADNGEAGEHEAADGQSVASASPTLSADDREFLVRVFRALREAVGPDVDVLKRQAIIFKEEIAGKSDLVKAKASTIRTKLEECCGEEPSIGTVAAGKYLAGVIGVEEKELAA